MSYFNTVKFTQPFIDNSGRLRVSQVSSLGDYKILNSDLQSLQVEYAGTGTVTNNVNYATMAVASGQYYIAQTKVYHPYLNGKSQFITITTDNMGTAANVNKSIGYLSSDATGTYSTGLDGFRLIKDTSDVYSFEVWKNGSRISNQLQSAWIDKLDGTGPSSLNINWNNFNIFAFDFLYLGGSTINCYVFYNGFFWLFNQYHNAGTYTSTMFGSPNKPVRYEIRSTSGSGSMDVICSEVATEGIIGEYGQYGNSITVKSTVTGTTLPNAGTIYGLCAVRKKTTQRDVFSFVECMEGMVGSADYVSLDLILNPTYASGTAFTFADVTNAPVQSAIANTATPPVYTAGTGTIVCSTAFSQNMNNAKPVRNILARLTTTLNNTQDVLVLTATPAFTSANVKAYGILDVKWYT